MMLLRSLSLYLVFVVGWGWFVFSFLLFFTKDGQNQSEIFQLLKQNYLIDLN